MRAETTLAILERCLALCPEIAPPDIRSVREPTVQDLLPLIIEEGCGFRPGRLGGIRLELTWFDDEFLKRKVPVIYNYGLSFSLHSGPTAELTKLSLYLIGTRESDFRLRGVLLQLSSSI